MLFSYKIAYKITTQYTPYQLVYGLHPLMPTKYIIPIVNGNERDNIQMKVLTRKIIELQKLQETKMKAIETTKIQQWNRTLWNQ
jgi:hypothetical protein